jgi:hypothetical protein
MVRILRMVKIFIIINKSQFTLALTRMIGEFSGGATPIRGEAKETSCKKDLSPSRLIPDSGSVLFMPARYTNRILSFDKWPIVVGQIRIP